MVYNTRTMRDDFSTFDVMKALGIPRERLREWMDRSFVKPTTPAQGQGSRASFTRDAVYGVSLFRLLVDYGFSRAVAGDFVGQFLSLPDHQEAGYLFLRVSVGPQGAGRKSILAIDRGDYSIHLKTGQTDDMKELAQVEKNKTLALSDTRWKIIFLVNLETLRQDVDGALLKV
jgi:hypothetical protein